MQLYLNQIERINHISKDLLLQKKLDVSSTGDTVIAIITMALQAGCSIKESVYLANYAEE